MIYKTIIDHDDVFPKDVTRNEDDINDAELKYNRDLIENNSKLYTVSGILSTMMTEEIR